MSIPRHLGAGVLLVTCLAQAACGQPESPARAALRDRLKQQATLSAEDLGRLRDEVRRSMGGKTFSVRQGETTRALDEEEQVLVFGMLSDPAGMFDEGMREEGGRTSRILNAPGRSSNSEIEVVRRLWIDAETFLPRRFQFNYAFPNPDDYSLELIVDP
jgi:hypothetical protein